MVALSALSIFIVAPPNKNLVSVAGTGCIIWRVVVGAKLGKKKGARSANRSSFRQIRVVTKSSVAAPSVIPGECSEVKEESQANDSVVGEAPSVEPASTDRNAEQELVSSARLVGRPRGDPTTLSKAEQCFL